MTGETQYTHDLRPNALLHVKLVLSPFASARVRGVAIEAALAMPGVVAVVTGRDLPALAVAGPDQPLARERVYFAGQPVAAAADGAARVDLDLDPLPAVTTPSQRRSPIRPWSWTRTLRASTTPRSRAARRGAGGQ